MIEISEDGIVLESSAKMMAELPSQAFGISLSDSDIEEMIACIQNGDTIELSLGECPAFIFGGQEIAIPHISECVGYDLFQSDPSNPSEYLNKLPNPTMGILTPLESSKPKPKTKKPKAPPKPKESTKANSTKPPTQLRKAASGESPTLAALPDKGDVGEDDAIANLKNSLARVEADKNTAVVVPGLLGSKGKARPSNRLLDNASPRSLPTSPALSSIRSPSLVSGTDQSRPQTFPIIHELALSELSFEDLFAKWNEGSEDEFRTALNKVADFDDELQKWTLKKKQWKELDVFEYDYATEEDRQTAIEHAIKQYDRQRVGPSDPIWQKLLPVSERGKGVCLSKLQAAFARVPAAPKPKGDSTSGSDKDESGSSSGMKGKGGEPMSRSSSQTSATGKKKLSASEAQAKRLLSNSKKPAAASTPKASPKVSPTKPQTKVPAAKAGRVLSKEFVSDSSSDDEVPLSTSLAKTKVAAAAAPSKSARETALSKAKARPASAIKTTSKEAEKEREKGTIRAEVVARPTKAATKRQRTTEDDDSSSSGTPLSKRVKAGAKAPVTAVNSTKTSSAKPRTVSDASQSGRGSVSAALTSKTKTTSPMKSSPLAASPPTNASDMEPERASRPTASEREREREREKEERERERQREVREREKERLREEREQERERQRELRDEREREKERRERERERAQTRQREREREREHSRDTVSSTSSGGDSTVSVISKKRPATDSYSEKASKKQRLSQDTLNKAFKFKQFYARYRLLHKEINDLEDPDPTKLNDLCEMHERLKKMKEEIYAEVPAEA